MLSEMDIEKRHFRNKKLNLFFISLINVDGIKFDWKLLLKLVGVRGF